MHLSALRIIKCDVIALLSQQAPLSLEEIQGALFETPGASVELALEKLEKEGHVTTDRNSNFVMIKTEANE